MTETTMKSLLEINLQHCPRGLYANATLDGTRIRGANEKSDQVTFSLARREGESLTEIEKIVVPFSAQRISCAFLEAVDPAKDTVICNVPGVTYMSEKLTLPQPAGN